MIMLHILLAILKVIGIILLSIIGLILFILLVIIYTPIRYKINGKCDGDFNSLKLDVKITFLFRLLKFKISFQEKKLVWQAQILWKKFFSKKDESDDLEANSNSSENDSDTSDFLLEEFEIDENLIKNEQKTKQNKTKPVESTPQQNISEKKEISSDEKKNASKKKKDTFSKEHTEKKKDTSSKEHTEKQSLEEKIDSLIEKIKCTTQKICDKINQIDELKETIIQFLEDEDHKIAFIKLIRELKRLCKKLKPNKLRGNIRFGFEDPSTTGKLLGGISILYPYIKDHIHVTADFEEKVLVGDIYIKGKLRISMLLSFVLYLIVIKSVRITITHINKLVKKGGK